MEHVGTQLGRVVERHEAAAELTYQAGHDALTGLPNRALLLDRLAMAANRSQRVGTPVGLLFIDVDRSKSVNDGLGHHAGDELLVALARRLDGLIRGADTVARLGGDEFVVLCDDLTDAAAVLSLAARVSEACNAAVPLGGKSTEVTVSVGVAVGRGAGLDADGLLRDADWPSTGPRSSVEAEWRSSTPSCARRATSAPAWRPPCAARSPRTRSRWPTSRSWTWTRRADRLRGPGALDGPGARTDLPGRVHPRRRGHRAHPRARRDGARTRLPRGRRPGARRWRCGSTSTSPPARSPPRIVERVAEVLERTALDPGRLGLELTETALLEETGTTVVTLDRLKALGVRLVLDDFGTATRRSATCAASRSTS